MALQGNSTKHRKKNECLSFSKCCKKLTRTVHCQIHSETTITLMPKPKRLQKSKLQDNIFDEYRCQNSPQNISKPNPTLYRKDHTEWSSGIYSRNVRIGQHSQINQCDRKNKNHMTISVDTEKHVTKFNIHSW